MNDSKVIPARLFGVKENTGAKVEFLLIKRKEGDIWGNYGQTGEKTQTWGCSDFFREPLMKANIKDYGDDGTRIVEFEYDGLFMERLEELGSMPLPPYIERAGDDSDKERYQTVYCREEGSVAAYGGTSFYGGNTEKSSGERRGDDICNASCRHRDFQTCKV